MILLMEETLHQLIGSLMVVYPIIYKVLHIPGGAGFLSSTVLNNAANIPPNTNPKQRPSVLLVGETAKTRHPHNLY